MHDKPSSAPPSEDAIALGHEPTAIRLRGLVWFFVIFFAVVAVVYAAVWALMVGIEQYNENQDAVRSPLALERQEPPSPLLQPSKAQGANPRQPWQDMAHFAAHEREVLSSYGVDESGRVRIPVSRAMEILAQRGLPTTDGRAATGAVVTTRPAQSP